jgi:hypothetical protein
MFQGHAILEGPSVTPAMKTRIALDDKVSNPGARETMVYYTTKLSQRRKREPWTAGSCPRQLASQEDKPQAHRLWALAFGSGA